MCRLLRLPQPRDSGIRGLSEGAHAGIGLLDHCRVDFHLGDGHGGALFKLWQRWLGEIALVRGGPHLHHWFGLLHQRTDFYVPLLPLVQGVLGKVQIQWLGQSISGAVVLQNDRE